MGFSQDVQNRVNEKLAGMLITEHGNSTLEKVMAEAAGRAGGLPQLFNRIANSFGEKLAALVSGKGITKVVDALKPLAKPVASAGGKAQIMKAVNPGGNARTMKAIEDVATKKTASNVSNLLKKQTAEMAGRTVEKTRKALGPVGTLKGKVTPKHLSMEAFEAEKAQKASEKTPDIVDRALQYLFGAGK